MTGWAGHLQLGLVIQPVAYLQLFLTTAMYMLLENTATRNFMQIHKYTSRIMLKTAKETCQSSHENLQMTFREKDLTEHSGFFLLFTKL